MIRFAIIGGGWRSEFYMRIASLLPGEFAVSGVYVRNGEKRADLARRYPFPFVESLEELLNDSYDFVVSCVSKGSICDMVRTLGERGIPLLTETPVGVTREEAMSMTECDPAWRVQVAEQFHLAPRYSAIKAVIDSGLLGEVHQVYLSACHDYHGVSLLRFLLGVGDTVPEILNIPLSDPVVRYRGRAGEVEETSVIPEERLTIYRFGDKTGIYDYSKEQYFSGIRMPLIHVKGTRGEMVNTTVRYLQDGVAHEFELKRAAFGEYENLDGMGIAAVTGHGRIWYKPPFEGARLSDEEMAIATALLKMSHYVKTGEDFYSLGSAAWDVALSCVQ
ncbi:MAG: Gfo/Idh/MocA family oxidoreductase [Clostridia bacterium]|nr:Gfo/Idh/MocA family oxidoreductase [Clostridia bacterium]